MNEQFENLLYESGLTAQGCWDELDSYAQNAIEKFAKLIVQECAHLVDDHDDSYPYVSFGNMIKQHFGVEE